MNNVGGNGKQVTSNTGTGNSEAEVEGDDFTAMRKKGIFVDVNITCQGITFGIHKLILAMSSDYFKRQFQKLDALASQPTNGTATNPSILSGKMSIILENVESVDIENALSYIYDGEVRVHLETVNGFLEVCKQLQLDEFPILVAKTDEMLKKMKKHPGSTRNVGSSGVGGEQSGNTIDAISQEDTGSDCNSSPSASSSTITYDGAMGNVEMYYTNAMPNNTLPGRRHTLQRHVKSKTAGTICN